MIYCIVPTSLSLELYPVHKHNSDDELRHRFTIFFRKDDWYPRERGFTLRRMSAKTEFWWYDICPIKISIYAGFSMTLYTAVPYARACLFRKANIMISNHSVTPDGEDHDGSFYYHIWRCLGRLYVIKWQFLRTLIMISEYDQKPNDLSSEKVMSWMLSYMSWISKLLRSRPQQNRDIKIIEGRYNLYLSRPCLSWWCCIGRDHQVNVKAVSESSHLVYISTTLRKGHCSHLGYLHSSQS